MTITKTLIPARRSIWRSGLCALAIAATSMTATTKADGLLYQLPKDGSSATFDLEVSVNGDGFEQSMTGSLTMRSVGVKEVVGERCRWIEFEMIVNADGAPEPKHVIAKTLMPEKVLKRGDGSFAHFKKAWLKQQMHEPTELKDAVGVNGGPLSAFLCGAFQDEKTIKAVKVESVLGELDCEGVTGFMTQGDGQVSARYEFDNRLHPKAPFGLVSSKIKIVTERNGQRGETMTLNLKLRKVETDAKSALPGHQ